MKFGSEPRACRLALLLIGLWAGAAHAETYTVTSLGDAGEGTLRAAVASANTNPGLDLIRFAVGGTITLEAPLEVSDDLRIDGAGQRVMLSGGGRVSLLVLKDANKMLEVARIALVDANYSQSMGGAIVSRGALRVTEALFVNNVAPVGGAIYSSGATLDVSNSTFANNGALSWGGAIAVDAGTRAEITSSTFVGNDAAQFGGALFQNPIYEGAAHKGAMVIRNSVISGVSAKGNCSLISNRLVDGGGNLNSDASCPFSAAKGSVNHTNPMLGELAHHGGPTMTFAPLPGSPAIDTGVGGPAAGPGLLTDQRGAGYARVSGAAIDRGAVELQATELNAGVVPARVAPEVAPATMPAALPASLQAAAPATLGAKSGKSRPH